MDRGTARRINRAHWDALASAHGQDAYYDSEALVAGADTLHEAEAAGVREAVGAVAGLDVLHLQCHIGFDSISLARRGARVVGADFSPASLEKARALARRCEVDVEFVEADSTKLPVELHNRFDLVYATIGVIGWIDDLGAWMRSAAAALRGGGKLLLVDIHPLFTMVASTDPFGSTSRTRTTGRAPLTSRARTRARTSTSPPPRPSSTGTRSPRSSTRRWRQASRSSASTSTSTPTSTRAATSSRARTTGATGSGSPASCCRCCSRSLPPSPDEATRRRVASRLVDSADVNRVPAPHVELLIGA